jgi:hypothetical protein
MNDGPQKLHTERYLVEGLELFIRKVAYTKPFWFAGPTIALYEIGRGGHSSFSLKDTLQYNNNITK